MSRILLADNSPHAQRMGERILREEGYEVVTVTDGQTAVMRLPDVDPDIVFADITLPRKSGYEICREVKSQPRFRHVRVVLTAGLLEHFDEAQAIAVRCDAILKKPFEASLVLETITPLIEAARRDRTASEPATSDSEPVNIVPVRVITDVSAAPSSRQPRLGAAGTAFATAPDTQTDPEVERVRAAVTLALDAAMPAMIDALTEQVLAALRR
jgi:CheY-like chemotaxis protein